MRGGSQGVSPERSTRERGRGLLQSTSLGRDGYSSKKQRHTRSHSEVEFRNNRTHHSGASGKPGSQHPCPRFTTTRHMGRSSKSPIRKL